MKHDQWFVAKRNPNSTLVYFIAGPDLETVTAFAKTKYINPIVVPLTWWIMRELTGCDIPGDKETTDFVKGSIFLPRRAGYEIVIKAL